MSLTSYRAAPPRVGLGSFLVFVWLVWRTWRRPTFPRLGPQYHGRWRFSRSSSGWDRVWSLRQSHQVVQTMVLLRPVAVPVARSVWCVGGVPSWSAARGGRWGLIG